MQLQNLKASKTTANPKLPEPFLQNHPLTSIQNHFSCFLQKISGSLTPKPLFLPFFPQNASSLKTQFDNTIQTIGNHAKQALQMRFFLFSPPSHPLFESARTPNFAWLRTPTFCPVVDNEKSSEASENRLKSITVYALKNSAGHFVWLPDVKSEKSLALFCFERKDAEALLEQVKAIDPRMLSGLKVRSVALDEVAQLNDNQGTKRYFIPNSSQIMNAPKEKVGYSAKDTNGVPVFQSQNLSVKIGNKRYHPVFFTKEDLDNSLKASHQQNSFNPAFKKGEALVCVLDVMIMGTKSLILVLTSQGKPKHPIFFRNENLDKPASHQQKDLNPLFREGDNQDCSLEKIIKEMKESPSSKWDKIIFIPPGGTNVSQ